MTLHWKCRGFTWTESPIILFKDKRAVILIRWITMMLQILLHHFIRDIAATPRAISNCPKVVAPISLFQSWKLRLQKTRSASFQAFNQIRESEFRRIFDLHMNVVFADYARQYANIFRVTDLHQQITTSNFNIALQNVIAIRAYSKQGGRLSA